MRNTAGGRQAGFTLIELLVVIAIIGTVVGGLLPAVQRPGGEPDKIIQITVSPSPTPR